MLINEEDLSTLPGPAQAVIERLVDDGVPPPVVGLVEAGVETVCAWPARRIALVDEDVDVPGYRVTCDLATLEALLTGPTLAKDVAD